jgi:MoaA/NifB/PqqE/SkfB family radical SAM enzyme
MSEIPDYTPKSNEAEWHITYKCDLACPNCNRLCFLPPTTADMTLDDAREFNRQARELAWFPKIVILGGEPTLHRDLFEFIEIASELSPGRVEVWSNG